MSAIYQMKRALQQRASAAAYKRQLEEQAYREQREKVCRIMKDHEGDTYDDMKNRVMAGLIEFGRITAQFANRDLKVISVYDRYLHTETRGFSTICEEFIAEGLPVRMGTYKTPQGRNMIYLELVD